MRFLTNTCRLIIAYLSCFLVLQSPLSASCLGPFAKHDFTSKVVVITGGSRGIGRALVEAFADAVQNLATLLHLLTTFKIYSILLPPKKLSNSRRHG